MKKHIHILGASGSGTTTLGKALSEKLNYTHYDTDSFYWLPTETPFTTKRPISERLALLNDGMEKSDNWVLSGSNCGWGDPLMDRYDLAVFLYVPPKARIQRLVNREVERYGLECISEGGDLYQAHLAFLEWAGSYDTGDTNIRSLALHNEWLKGLKCPVIRIEGEQSVEERAEIVMKAIYE